MVDIKEATAGQQTNFYPDEKFKEMVEAGVFYGRKNSKTHPRMRQYILSTRNNIEIINLNKTAECLEAALGFLKEKIINGGTPLFVGTEPAAAGIKDIAEEFNFPVVATRWLGGTLTNFQIISKRIEYLKKMRSELAAGVFEKYTKKERLLIEQELKRLTELLGGLENLTALPDVLIIIDPVLRMHMTAVREARRLRIPIIAMVNTDGNPELVDYPVPANTKARLSINWFLGKVRDIIKEAKAAGSTKTARPESLAGETQEESQEIQSTEGNGESN
jgi:small subunit ribosomal protein S2